MNEALVRDFINAVKAENKKTSAYDTPATVTRIDGGTAWVHIPGGVDETPIKMTVNAKEGDTVQVRVADGRAWIVGNETAPPTDDAKANEADKKAAEAKYLAVDAVDAALKADIAAQDAILSAETARAAAETAQETAEGVEGIAEQAQQSAESASASATNALNQLSIVEDVVGVLGWISTHATYQLTSDDSVTDNKWYFTYDAGTDSYNVVLNPTGDPSAQGWYELVSIDEAVQDYVTAHVALTSDGLYLQDTANSQYKVLIATDGLSIIGQNGATLAKYGTNAVIGDADGFHVQITNNRLSFYRDSVHEVAYISGDKLYITQSVVLQQMDVGTPVADGGLGQWSWKVHAINGQNNLYLKWLG